MSFRDFIFDKSVLLLGPASYMQENKINPNFDDYDTIIKLNKMVEKNYYYSNFDNDRCDVLYHCLDINIPNGDLPYKINAWVKSGVRHLRITHPPVTPYYKNNLDRFYYLNKDVNIKNSCVGIRDFVSVVEGSNTSPNAGTIAIYDILQNNPKSLSIKGITFCKTPYTNGYKEDTFDKNKKSQHDPDKQICFFKKLLNLNNETITIDKELEMLLNNLEKK